MIERELDRCIGAMPRVGTPPRAQSNGRLESSAACISHTRAESWDYASHNSALNDSSKVAGKTCRCVSFMVNVARKRRMQACISPSDPVGHSRVARRRPRTTMRNIQLGPRQPVFPNTELIPPVLCKCVRLRPIAIERGTYAGGRIIVMTANVMALSREGCGQLERR